MRNPKMTLAEAKKMFKEYGCSLFSFAREDLDRYNLYKELNIDENTQNLWKEETINELLNSLRKSGEVGVFNRLYDIAVTFHDHQRLKLLVKAIDYVKAKEERDLVTLAETIMGRSHLSVRSGMIFWAHDLGLKSETKSLVSKVKRLIGFQPKEKATKERIARAKKKITTIERIVVMERLLGTRRIL